MKLPLVLRILPAATLLTSLCAQSVQIGLDAIQPLVVTATAGVTSVGSAPAGPLPASGQVSAFPGPGVSAACVWSASAGRALGAVVFTHSMQVTGAASSSVGPLEFLVTLTASSQVDTRIEFERSDNIGAGAPAAAIDLDLDNDGVFEVPLTLGSLVQPLSRSFSAVPYRFRVRIGNQMSSPGAAGGRLAISVTPDNGLTVVPTAVSCSPSPDVLFYGFPVFADAGYSFFANSFYSDKLSAMVIGLAQQPILLPQLAAAPCVLVPRPDVVIPLLPGQQQAGVTFNVPLPPSVRPVTLQGQLVYLENSGQLSVGDGWAVSAQ